MFIRHFVAVASFAATVAVISGPAFAKTVTAADFVHKASVAGTFEVEASKLALQKTRNPEIRALAQKMIDDHTQSSDALAAATPAAMKPAEDLDDAHRELLTQLQGASGDQFDHIYIAIQADTNTKVVTLYSDYSVNGSVTPLRTFANSILPTLDDHLQQIQNIAAKGL
jgi:putative membrane protein